MPVVTLSRTESQLVLLAAQEKDRKQQIARDLYAKAEQEFQGHVAPLIADHQVPEGVQANFNVTDGKGTITWPDAEPATPVITDERTLALVPDAPETVAEQSA